jgi:hypothetical protein
MIGMLFDSVGARTVVASASHYASQHNAFRWEVERTQFTRATLADVAKLLDHTLNTWLTEVSQAERQAFLEASSNCWRPPKASPSPPIRCAI